MHASLSLLALGAAALTWANPTPFNSPYGVTGFSQGDDGNYSMDLQHDGEDPFYPFMALCSGAINGEASGCSVYMGELGLEVTTKYTHREAGGHQPHLNAREIEIVATMDQPDGSYMQYSGSSNWFGRDSPPRAFNGSFTMAIPIGPDGF